MTYQTTALYGDARNTSYLSADMMNPAYAESGTDWGAILTNGIRGAADGAIGAMMREAYASGQLQPMPQPYQQQQQPKSIMPLLIIGGIVYMLAKG